MSAGKIMVDRHPQARIYSDHPIGLDQAELKNDFGFPKSNIDVRIWNR